MNSIIIKGKQFSKLMVHLLSRHIALLVKKLFFSNKKQRIWVIGCGGERWGDNADAFWQYANEKDNNLKAIAIMKKSAGFISKKHNWAFKRSIKSYIYILISEALITTHGLYDLGPSLLVDYSNAIKVRLQHGVISIKKMPVCNQKLMNFDLICASSVREKQIMVEEMKLDSETVSITGLARHDRLRQKGAGGKREGILYMPTIRDWVSKKEKQYYSQLLFSWLEDYLARFETRKIKIWLHPNWTKMGFEVSEHLSELAVDNKNDFQDILLQSELLVTDYSSVAFDAALVGIPVVFYQPDRKVYIDRRGLYEGFVNQKNLLVTEDAGNLVAIIEKILIDKEYHNCRLRKDQQWAHQYVETFDGKCCARIFDEINALANCSKERRGPR